MQELLLMKFIYNENNMNYGRQWTKGSPMQQSHMQLGLMDIIQFQANAIHLVCSMGTIVPALQVPLEKQTCQVGKLDTQHNDTSEYSYKLSRKGTFIHGVN